MSKEGPPSCSLVFVWALRFCKLGAPSVDVNGRGRQLFVGVTPGGVDPLKCSRTDNLRLGGVDPPRTQHTSNSLDFAGSTIRPSSSNTGGVNPTQRALPYMTTMPSTIAILL
jgi:hypothetical protein